MHGPFVQRQILTNLKLPRAAFLCQPRFFFHEAVDLDLYLLDVPAVREDLRSLKHPLYRPLPAAHPLLWPFPPCALLLLLQLPSAPRQFVLHPLLRAPVVLLSLGHALCLAVLL